MYQLSGCFEKIRGDAIRRHYSASCTDVQAVLGHSKDKINVGPDGARLPVGAIAQQPIGTIMARMDDDGPVKRVAGSVEYR